MRRRQPAALAVLMVVLFLTFLDNTVVSVAVISAETAGFAALHVTALLCVSVVAGVVFLWREGRTAHPLLDLRYLRVPRFLTASVVAGAKSHPPRPRHVTLEWWRP